MVESNPLAVVLLSGGMDSCVTAAIASEAYEVAALHSSYGQRTATKERECFDAIAAHFGVRRRLVIDQSYMTGIGGSALTDLAIDVPEGAPAEGEVPSTYVPFRNAHFLSAAVSWAEVIGATAIFIGAVEQDSSGYPDCRPEYYEAFAGVVAQGTRPETSISIETPLIGLSKAEIIEKGGELGAPLHLTWSCYRDSESACGCCDSCRLRLRAFEQAGVADPISYSNR